MINQNPYNLYLSSPHLHDTNKTLEVIDKKIEKLLRGINTSYGSGRDAKHLSIGILNDRSYLYKFDNIFSEPICRKSGKANEVPENTILPNIYYEFSWLNKEIVLDAIDSGYRMDTASGMYNISIEDKSIHNYVKKAEQVFEEYKDAKPSDIRAEHTEQIESLKKENRFIYYKIYDVLQRLPKDLIRHKIKLARLFFQWASGTILNYFLYQYKLSNEVINKYLDTNQNWDNILDINGLNELRKENARRMLFAIISKYVLLQKKDRREPIYEELIDKMDHQELKMLHKNKASSSNDKRGEHNKPEKIMPEPKFWEIAADWVDPLTESGNPKGELLDALETAKYEIGDERRKLVGYKRKDRKKENPLTLTRPTIRRRLKKHPENWLNRDS